MTQHIARSIRYAVAALALVLATAHGAAAQAGWGSTADTLSAPVNTGGAIGFARVGVDAAGNAIALWSELGPTPFGTGSIVRTARFDVAAGRWGSPQTIVASSRSQLARDIVVDDAGNALAIWSANPISVTIALGASRYDAATGTWSDATPAPTGLLTAATVAMNRGGDAVLCWTVMSFNLACRRYLAAGAAWQPIESVGGSGGLVDVAIDAAGNVQAVWLEGSAVRTARFDAATGMWSTAVDLDTTVPTASVPSPQVAMNEAGDAVAVWSRGAVLQASRRSAGSSTWTTAATLASDGLYNEFAQPVVATDGAITVASVHTASTGRTIQVSRYDPMASTWTPAADLPGQGGSGYGPPSIDVDRHGNVHVVWSQSLVSPQIRLLASRYAVATGLWTTAINLSTIDQAAYNSDVATDAAGNAVAVWFQIAGGFSAPQSLRWAATPAAPVITGVSPAAAMLTVPFTMAAGADPALTPTTIQYSLDGGTTWLTRTPASIASPLVLTGLADGVPYALQLRAVNAAGTSLATPILKVRSGVGDTPAPLRVISVSGSALTLAWAVPAAGLVPTDYLLEGGVAPGQTLASLSLGTAMSLITLTNAPAGTFYLRVVGVNGGRRGGVSNEVRVVIGAAGVPATPAGLLGLADGSNLTLSWTNSAGGGVPTALVLNVSGPVSGSATLPVSEQFAFANVPPGTYTFTVAALNASGASAASAPVTLSFPATCAGPPAAPSPAGGNVVGNVLSLTWEPPQSGPAVSGYALVVTGAYTGTIPVAGRALSGGVASGQYGIGVVAVNACGSSAPSPAVTFVVP